MADMTAMERWHSVDLFLLQFFTNLFVNGRCPFSVFLLISFTNWIERRCDHVGFRPSFDKKRQRPSRFYRLALTKETSDTGNY